MAKINEYNVNVTKEQADEFVKNYRSGDKIPDEMIQYAKNWLQNDCNGICAALQVLFDSSEKKL